MSVYMTEEEQLQAIKAWWKRYQNVITVSLSIVLLIVAGYRYWNWHQDKVTQQASNTYEQLMIAFSNNDRKAIRSYANALIKDYNHTVYADAARLSLAKLDIDRDHYDNAKKNLQEVARHSKIYPLQQIAKIRLSRLLIENKSYDQALTELNQVSNLSYAPVVNELKGDVYLATGRNQLAIDAYKTAMSQIQTSGINNLFLEMKTNQLLALTQSQNHVTAKNEMT